MTLKIIKVSRDSQNDKVIHPGKVFLSEKFGVLSFSLFCFFGYWGLNSGPSP
jgi:hypothetical protein